MNFCWHKYGKWSDPIQTGYTDLKQQWRVCERCNKAQFRTLWWDRGSYLRDVLDALKTARGNALEQPQQEDPDLLAAYLYGFEKGKAEGKT